MIREKTDPAQLSGEALDEWYRRTPDEIAQERSRREQEEYDAFFGGLRREEPSDAAGSWQEARVVRPRTAGGYVPPRAQRDRARGAVQPSGTGAQPGAAGSFFDQAGVIPNPRYGPGYYSDLPRPLNVVEPELGGWFRLNDNTRVRAGELERLYAEQQRMIDGDEGVAPAQHVRSADRLKDGYIPRADQLAKGEREMDSTCHPYGGWEHDAGFPTYSERVRRYETQITRAPGLDYVVRLLNGRVVKFDGCAVWDPERQLLEAKGPGRGWVLDFLQRAGRPLKVVDEAVTQAGRQIGVAQGRRVEWHAADRRYGEVLRNAIRQDVKPPPTFTLDHTPAR